MCVCLCMCVFGALETQESQGCRRQMGSLQRWPDLAELWYGEKGPTDLGIRHGQMAPVTGRLMQRLKLLALGHVGLRPVVQGTAMQRCGAGECSAQGSRGSAKENKRGLRRAAITSLLNAVSGTEEVGPRS